MRYLRRRRRFDGDAPLEDPIAGVANLFDASVVFIVSMMIALFMAYNMMDLLDPNAKVTMTRKGSDGSLEVITREGSQIKVQKVTDKKLGGEGERLGAAFRLKDGRVVYVPD
ncbi:hypothetical protein MSC49_36450 [Methylosinus sp. C49]|uniref:DUF2149 domain-containing protein n=1 Tax=Methylosinus sp. C49 TaxID=2699395 RepID=UPI001366A394|nr:DUF2149 domain-containing protein [Methylosinus sp. C49]BBU63710.1 hypothetical protein MSC49_36450 [Methylosinus sp. C49]